jgi:hypothetical protein
LTKKEELVKFKSEGNVQNKQKQLKKQLLSVMHLNAGFIYLLFSYAKKINK